MTIDDIIDQVAALDGVLVLRPQPGDGSPQISWGDVFIYYAPTGEVPRTQPFATIVTKDYPDEPASGLDRPGAFRLNIGVPASASAPQSTAPQTNPTTPDAWFPHPVYGRVGWISVVDPAEQTSQEASTLLETAHAAARRRYQRRLPGLTMPAPNAPGDFDLTVDELREVTRHVAGSAAHVQDIFQRAHPQDPRVGAAIDAAWEFVRGGPRNRRQRSASREAHRAAKDASTEAARLAARAAGDAASPAYLHPLAKAHQIAHILRAAACAARIAELAAGDDPAAGAKAIEDATARATPVLIEVLSRYPAPPAGKNRVDQLMSALDTSLRARRVPDPARGGNGPSRHSRPLDTGRAVEAEARCERVVHTPASNTQPAIAARAAAGRPVRGKVPGHEHQECLP